MTPFNLFDDDEIEEEEEKELKGVLVQQASGSVTSGSGSAPSALLSEKLQVGEISLVPTDPTWVNNFSFLIYLQKANQLWARVLLLLLYRAEERREKNLFIYQSIFISLSLSMLKDESSFYQSINQSISFAFVDTTTTHTTK